jgi:hypothetical protein
LYNLVLLLVDILVVGLDIDSIAGASLWLHLPTVTMRGNAVAISATKALTALHGHASVSTEVSLRDTHGIERLGRIIFSKYEANSVDIAVIQLHDDQNHFSTFVPVCRERVCLLRSIFVIRLATSLNGDESALYTTTGEVTYIEPGANSSLFRSTYQSQDGLSGAGIVVVADGGGFHIVGVHIGAHDDTTSPPPAKKTKTGNAASADSVSELSQSLASSIHGHTAYCLICEVARVDGISDVLYTDRVINK